MGAYNFESPPCRLGSLRRMMNYFHTHILAITCLGASTEPQLDSYQVKQCDVQCQRYINLSRAQRLSWEDMDHAAYTITSRRALRPPSSSAYLID
jgi:hypothetical protein